jgi:beta-lactamase class A
LSVLKELRSAHLCTLTHAKNATVKKTIISLLILLFPCLLSAQSPAFRRKLEKITKDAKGHVGIAWLTLEERDSMTINGYSRYPMQSTFKFPLALAVLDMVDKGTLNLFQPVHFSKADYRQTWSPIMKAYPNGDMDLPLKDVLKFTVGQSDNIGCDMLFKLIGGTTVLNGYLHQHGIDSIAVVADEKGMAQAWDVQYGNWSNPWAMAMLLDNFYRGKYLSEGSTALLRQMMEETTTGPNRLRGLLPKEATVAHKTGTSDTNEKGLTAATNDVGVITLPDGKHVALVVFVSDSKADEATREGVIARISQAVWDYLQ